MVELGTIWLLMIVLNQDPGPAYLSGNISIQSFEPKQGMSTVVGSVAFDLRPGREKAWAELTTRTKKKPRHQIMIFRFDREMVYRLDPEKKTYSERPIKDGHKILEKLRDIYLGGPNGKKRARTVPLPKGITDKRVCKQIKTGPYTTIFYIDRALENAVTRIDVNFNKKDFAIVNQLKGAKITPIPESRFEIPEDYTKK